MTASLPAAQSRLCSLLETVLLGEGDGSMTEVQAMQALSELVPQGVASLVSTRQRTQEHRCVEAGLHVEFPSGSALRGLLGCSRNC